MLEGLVAWVLNNYLGKYVENLNTDQLSVALLSGKVELENLPLKKDALRHLGLPVEIKAGFIGKVQLQVPVRQIRSAPWLIAIEKLYLVAAPVNLDEWDSVVEASIAHDRKVALLDALEAQWRAEHEATDAGYYATSYSSWLSYGTGLLANIVENLQLKLNDVHIRYEDALTCAPKSFACGLTVESLTAESCDSSWQRGFTLLTADVDGCSYKLLELNKMAVYWDQMQIPSGMFATCTLAELTERMSQTWQSTHRYLLVPANATARVRRERTEQPLRSRTRPRLHCHLTLNAVQLDLTTCQYNEAVGCTIGLERIGRLREFRALRPATPVKGHTRLWWLYALKCHCPHHHWYEPKPTWDSCIEASKQTRQYVSICLSTLTNPTATLPADQKAIKDEFEWKTPLHILKPLREVAMRKVPKATPVSTPEKPGGSGRSMLVHWFPQWWGWYGTVEPQDSAPPSVASGEATPALEEEILDVLADSIENNTVLKRDTVFGKFEFTLNKGSLNLNESSDNDKSKEEEEQPVGLELQFSSVGVCFETRPRASSHALHASLGAVCVRERITKDTLFPIIVAPQGTIREGLSAMNSTANIMTWCRAQSAPPPKQTSEQPLFQLTYEKRPFQINSDYRIWVKSSALEVVWCSAVAQWLGQTARAPWGQAGPPLHYAQRTTDLISTWDHMMHAGERRSWHVELDISAPQILLVENLCDREASVLVVDFGRLQLANAPGNSVGEPGPTTPDDEEMFMTPCSTPPGSLLSPASPPEPPLATPMLDATNLHSRLYDKYKIELSDLQILVGKARDNWKYAHTKSTSTLHLLDRFSISLQAERRVIQTNDPQYPTATLCGTLPALVVHLSEHKLKAAQQVLRNALPSRSREPPSYDMVDADDDEETSVSSEAEKSEPSSMHQNTSLYMLQFAIDQMSLEVQSRGRSIAEVQVCGVRVALAARPVDLSLSLSVHSLLLVDALQTYGPDFELLVASHKHVGMDTASGSIRDSEPTSPTSPVSLGGKAPPPHKLQQALYELHYESILRTGQDTGRLSPAPSLTGGNTTWHSTNTHFNGGAKSPPGGGAPHLGSYTAWGPAGVVDSEALIAVELCLVKGEGNQEDLRIANILFNNLDIIANQETIVELIGFAQRVLGPPTQTCKNASSDTHIDEKDVAVMQNSSPLPEEEFKQKEVRTEITFDFHRLGVLLLRAAVQEGAVVAKKIATATVSEAKIQATVGSSVVEVEGSLGGVQVVSLCEGIGVHTRVISAGRAPPLAPHLAPHYTHAQPRENALLFTVTRKLLTPASGELPVVDAKVSIRVASVWYTHSGNLLRELRSCLSEFKQYLTNLARSIRAAATDMAIGLVHPRGDSLYVNPKLSMSMEGVSPRRRTTSMGMSLDDPPDLKPENIVLSITIELESPVVVMPRSAQSTEVLIAHLGRMSLSNKPGPASRTAYRIRVRDISLATLDVHEKLKTHTLTAESMEQIYDVSSGKPVLHNTALQLTVNYGGDDDNMLCEISGKVVGGLQVSARREQYEQLLETIRWASEGDETTQAHSEVGPRVPQESCGTMVQSSDVVDVAVPTLRLDPALRAAVLAVPPPHASRQPVKRHTPLKVHFELPHFTVELVGDLGEGERNLVQLAFTEFTVKYDSIHQHETMLQVSLHSITMEDLTQDPESKHRTLLESHSPAVPRKAVFVSRSCPDFTSRPPCDILPDDSSLSELHMLKNCWNSLPDGLNVIDKNIKCNKRDSKCGVTPPCSPECDAPVGEYAETSERERTVSELSVDDNLVWISVHTRDPQHPHFENQFNKVAKLTKVEFNCLKLVLSVDSWVAVLDFFGVAGDDDDIEDEEVKDSSMSEMQPSAPVPSLDVGMTQWEMSIRSLSVVVVRRGGECCRALVSRLGLRSETAGTRKVLDGKLGALALQDLTVHSPLWRDRLKTHAHNALTFTYNRLSPTEAVTAGHESSLSISMGPVSYAHTKRFVRELHAFADDFSLLRGVIAQARRKVSLTASVWRSRRLRLRIDCKTPVIVLPVSGRSRHALVVELKSLRLNNCFKYAGDPGTVSTMVDPAASVRERLEVRTVTLEGATLWCGIGGRSLRVRRRGPPLLPAPSHLTLQIDNNCSDTHNVADQTIHGHLSTLECALDLAQYKLVRGVLTHNLGETVDDLLVPTNANTSVMQNGDQVWTTMSLKLDLQDVKVRLVTEHGKEGNTSPPSTSKREQCSAKEKPTSTLACINFIKSRLLLETRSDLSQDVDLVSQEILVSDTRYVREPANRRGNVFTNIVQPQADSIHSVQAEVHARRRGESSAYTILINNMRLMAILDWWEAAYQFIMQPPHDPADPDQMHLEEELSSIRGASSPNAASSKPAEEAHMELKLNVTDSQLVLVEDASVWDTNAVILKSTTVISYRPIDERKPVVCELNELEVFSCVLGMEEETALSIVDPAALTVTIHADRVLHLSTRTLNLRLSYHDMKMFAAMIQSLPVQARAALSGKSNDEPVEPDAPANRVYMGPSMPSTNAGRLIRPRWLPLHPPAPPPPPKAGAVFPLTAVKLNADCITLCVIDDCLDSDVPLLEVAMSEMALEQDLRKAEESLEDPKLVQTPAVAGIARGAGGGWLTGVLHVDYYNRTLSGWEPCIEPWRFESRWEYQLSSSLSLGRIQVDVTSNEVLGANVTSSLVELTQLVRKNWTADYYAPQTCPGVEQSPKGSPAGHRRRSPFVPYALRNQTGLKLWFTTIRASSDLVCESWSCSGPDDSWVVVRAGETEPFSFGARRGRTPHNRHTSSSATAPAITLHQLALALEGWAPPDPICVDRVGVFFRKLTHIKTGAEAWLVLEVCLEGSARKLVTVRSALQLVNTLPHTVEVRVEQAAPPGVWSGGSRTTQVSAGATWSAPLSSTANTLWVRPLVRAPPAPPPAPAPVDWRLAQNTHSLMHYECRASHDHVYKFCCCITRERFPADRSAPLAAHTLRLVPALRLENLLPVELHYRAIDTGTSDAGRVAASGTIPPGDTQPFHQVNVEEGVELSVKLEGFAWSTPVSVGGTGTGQSFSARVKLRDVRGRRLDLNARVSVKKTEGIKVCVSAAYWLVNRSGVPLVFRAEGAAQEAAGQFEEHEAARVVAPLLFAFAHTDGPPTLTARLGNMCGEDSPQWCSPFGLGVGATVRKLEVGGSGGEKAFAVGVAVRQGRGRYRHTNITTFTPRYQIHNNSSHHLQFAQKCTATTLNDPGAVATHVSAVPGCYVPWQWARWERQQLACVRILDTQRCPRTHWSGGFRIEQTRTLHLACRECSGGGGYQLLRVEIVSQGASIFVVVTDAECAPAPLRIDNYSPVAIMFHQVSCGEECVVGAHATIDWALPEPEGARALSLRAPGGPRTTLSLDTLPATHQLLYQNFIYVVFTYTTQRHRDKSMSSPGKQAAADQDDGVLVLEVPLGSTKVVLGRKRYGDRSQLWRRGVGSQLIHEGSSPPQPTDANLADDTISPHAMVLDIEGPAPRPGRAAPLVLRRADPRRTSTQTWRLHEGRMACAHANLCVQPDGGLMSLAPGNRVVLGMAEGPRGGGKGTVPSQQAVAWHTLRPGSGRLDVALACEGPTRVVTIRDRHVRESDWLESTEETADSREIVSSLSRRREWGVRVSLGGLSLSLVARAPPAELVHAMFAGVLLDMGVGAKASHLALTVREMQWDNQLLGTPSPVLLYCLPDRSARNSGGGPLPALHAALELMHTPHRRYNAYFFKHLIVALRPIAVRLEERLILKLWAWAAFPAEDTTREEPDEVDYETRRVLDQLTALHATRYYFALIEIIPAQIRLSMFTASKLESDLAVLKRRLGLTFIRFEDATVELEPFVRTHPFETASYLAQQLLKHFKDELKWQAARILGSVDFLGNPLGFVADVSEGVSGLLLEGNVAALLKNVTHGISNSAAKVTESLGDGLERVVSDEAHEETRRRIRSTAAGAHLVAGLRGFGLGILGGMTSLVKHSYEGATQEGLGGFLTGVGKGLVGTVTKPVIGVLDLAAETASALRETSRRSDKWVPERVRAPRCAVGAGGLVARYCGEAAAGMALLHALGAPDPREQFVACRAVRAAPHDIRAHLSTHHLRIFTCKHSQPHIVMETHLSNLVSCSVVSVDGAHYVELCVRGGGGLGEGLRRPRVQCDSAELAAWLSRHAAYAKQLYHEQVHTLLPHEDV